MGGGRQDELNKTARQQDGRQACGTSGKTKRDENGETKRDGMKRDDERDGIGNEASGV